MTINNTAIRFPLGQIVATPGALDALHAHNTHLIALLRRHATGDWGDLDEENCRANAQAIDAGVLILSAYTIASGVTIWILTEGDRSATTVLLPSDY